jgi:hypothetical protein
MTHVAPMPWMAEHGEEGAFVILDIRGRVVCSRGPWPNVAEESYRNGEFIARAANVHFDMLNALEVLLSVTDKRGHVEFNGFVEDEKQPIEIRLARAAIAKAKGEV